MRSSYPRPPRGNPSRFPVSRPAISRDLRALRGAGRRPGPGDRDALSARIGPGYGRD
ncbi:hypothetical protein [Blastococcus sp. SYSU DS0973]